ncbi:MAG: hypothetical protein ACE366_15410 [Bradymonadia bacterium]
MRPTLALLMFAAAALMASTASANSLPASANGYSVTLERPYGGALPTYYHNGSTYVLGAHGDRYNVRVTNHTGRRIEAVVTVDGRDAISGDLGDFKRQRGYLIDPHDSIVIEGFRRSLSDVAAFRFTSPGDSYSGRRGTPQHVGVIGVAVFPEKKRRPRRMPLGKVAPPPSPRPWWGFRGEEQKAPVGGLADNDAPAAEAAPAPAMDATMGDVATATPRRKSRRSGAASGYGGASRNNIGTRYGESQYSPVVEVEFKRARKSRPAKILGIYYDDAEGLSSRGIQVYPHYSGQPSPFPAQRFAPSPY